MKLPIFCCHRLPDSRRFLSQTGFLGPGDHRPAYEDVHRAPPPLATMHPQPNTTTQRTKPAMSPPDSRRFLSQTGFMGPGVPGFDDRAPPPAFVPAQPPPPPGLPPSREAQGWDALAARLQAEEDAGVGDFGGSKALKEAGVPTKFGGR